MYTHWKTASLICIHTTGMSATKSVNNSKFYATLAFWLFMVGDAMKSCE